MSTLFENIERIATAKEEIRQSIINKGVEVSEDLKIEDYSSKIDLITTGQPGGGGEDWKLNNWNYIVYQNKSAADNIKNIIKHFDDSAGNIQYFYNCGTVPNLYGTIDASVVKKIFKDFNFSNITSISNSFTGYFHIEEDTVIDINLSNCEQISNTMYNIGLQSGTGKLIIDFHGSTTNVYMAGSFLTQHSSKEPAVKEILNIALNKLRSTSCLTGHSAVTRLTFDGSFGSDSTTSSLTLDLSRWTSLTADAFLETMTTISTNTSGKTRIFKLPAALYSSLTDDIWDLADEKLYDIAS